MDVDKNLITAISTALKKEIKFICLAFQKKGTIEPAIKVIFCLGQETFHILDEFMKSKEDYSYEDIELIVLDRRHTDTFYIHVKAGGFLAERKKLTFSSSPREKLIKNFMCYYSILYMFRYSEIRDLRFGELTNETKKQLEKKENDMKKGKHVSSENFGKYKKLNSKKYCFYVKHAITNNYDNVNLKINYVKDEEEVQTGEYFSDSCQISDEVHNTHMSKDDRELGFYALTHFSTYMRNIEKSTSYWILKNTVYQKKFNLNEDKCTWDGWTIECRISDPSYKNLVFIYYRRKFLPPFFDRFINIAFILEEKCSKNSFQINPKAYEVIHSMANTIHPESNDMGSKEYERLLEAKFDGLIFDDETYYYFQNILKIYGRDSYLYGFAFLQNILNFLEENIKEKEKITPLKSYLDQKKKLMFSSDNDLLNNELHRYRLIKLNDMFLQELDPNDKPKEDDKRKAELETDVETKRGNEAHTSVKKITNENKINWRSKVRKFLCYCVNGGLTDYGFTLEILIYYLQRCPTNTQEYFTVINRFMDIRDLESNETEGSGEDVNIISSLTENSKLSFNEEAVAVCIKSGWLSKSLSAESAKHCPNFIKLLLNNVCEFLKTLSKESQGDGGGSDDSERREYSTIIGTLVSIFSNTRNCPTIIIIACKCLCALVSNEGDYKNKLILIQNDIITKLAVLIELRFDEKMLLCLLELLYLVLPEAKLTIVIYLYKDGIGDVNLIEKLKNLLVGPGIAGTYFSIRIITIFLSLTSIHQADLRNKLNQDKYKDIYGKVLKLLDERNKVFEPTEEMSYVLEYKIYFLLSILIYKNLRAQEILINDYNLLDIIEDKCGKYYELMNSIMESRKNKLGLADQKIESLLKTLAKFYELVTFLLSGEKGIYNTERIKKIKVKNNNFSNLYDILGQNDDFISNYDNLLTSYLWIKKLLRSIDTEDII